ncbi:MAG: glycosyltransferase family 39 protein [Anaerolineaceae bacterium]|nr:glycosyltransferase family 39 protein [Anaerolineaceae bacterium]
MKWFSQLNKKIDIATWAAIIFFLCLFVLGFMICSDYGMSWDEPEQVYIGQLNAKYAVRGNPELLEIRNRWYGPSFEIFLYAVRDRSNTQQMYLSRHLWTFIAFFVCCIFFYLLARRITKHNVLALIGTVFLVISPRIFANSFYNSKDIPFLVLYCMSILSMVWFLDKQTIWRGLFHALITAAAITIRLPAIIIPAFTLLGLGIEMVNQRINWKAVIISSMLYLIVTTGFVILFWPALWTEPWQGFLSAFELMSKHPNGINMLFMGNIISSFNMPWFYIPVWIAISTPLLYLIAFIPGLFNIIYNQKNWIKKEISLERRDEVLILLAFFMPLLTVILLHSYLYDAWRQMFFVYPAFLLISIKGLQWAWQQLNNRLTKTMSLGLASIILLIGMLPVCLWMVKNHPYQNIHFNQFAGKDMQTIQQHYMLDFWGLAYREGIEAILNMDDSAHIQILVETPPGQFALKILAQEEANHIQAIAPEDNTDYFIGNYYMIAEPYPYKNEVYTVKVDHAKILSVYRLSEEEKSIYFNPIENRRELETP